jgi:MoaA/NifB/PqqE/SkfB family radical SAM enzyme
MKPVCLAPWAHSHLTASGGRSVCCNSGKDFGAMSFDDWWNSDYLKELRLKMLRGEIADECKSCFTTSIFSYASHFNNSFGGYLNQMLDKTAEDGSTTYMPVSMDYRTDLCNLKCRTCGPSASTSIQAELLKHGYLDQVESPHSIDIAEIEQLIQNIDRIYWAGGEPLMNPVHWQVMERLAKIEKENLHISYSSNCMINDSVWNKFIELSKSFKNFSVLCSVDGFGTDGEYIRTGFKSDVFFDRILQMKEAGIWVLLDVTLTSLGLLSLPQICAFSKAYNIPLTIKPMVVNPDNSYLAIYVAQKEVLERTRDIVKATELDEFTERQIVNCLDALIRDYKPACVNEAYLNKYENMRGDVGYFMSRMKGKINRDNNLILVLLI